MYSIDDLNKINNELLPLKALADRELQSIYGLSGLVYIPHIDAYNEVSIKKAEILLFLKNNHIIPFTDVETITAQLMALYPRAKSKQLVEFEGDKYECKFLPLKLSKSGKTIRKWAKFWLRKLPNGEVDKQWEVQVKEIWPQYFILRNIQP